MTTFTNGVAEGHTLQLRRTPFFLRVVKGARDEVDALDQLTDSPGADETIHLYRLIGVTGGVTVRVNRRTVRYPIASYRLNPEQPDDETLRDPELWQQWCHAHAYEQDLKS